ncbi:hypothetical protein G6F22_016167 [Rhizopus arrhizus]|nr:hypothetical protein G6F22_016167 [Rhizopus arrhizus]
MIGRIDEGGHLRQLLAVGLDRLRRDALVLGTEVKDHRGLGRLIEELHVARTVVADRGQTQAHCRQHRHGTAPAVADRADLAVGSKPGCRGADHFQCLLHAQRGNPFQADLHALGAVGEGIGVGIGAVDQVEERRRQHRVALGGEALGHAADVRVGAEDFLHHHQPATRGAFRQGLPGPYRAVMGIQGDPLGHRHLPRCREQDCIVGAARVSGVSAAVRDRAAGRSERGRQARCWKRHRRQ